MSGGDWVSVERLATKKLGKPIFFRRWTRIGPETTANLDEAEKFDSERAARAVFHPLAFFDAKPVSEYRDARTGELGEEQA